MSYRRLACSAFCPSRVTRPESFRGFWVAWVEGQGHAEIELGVVLGARSGVCHGVGEATQLAPSDGARKSSPCPPLQPLSSG